MNNLAFDIPLKSFCDVGIERPCYVTVGKDNFTNILLGKGTGKSEGENGKSVFASNESDINTYIDQSQSRGGINKETWGKFETVLLKTFGEKDLRAGKGQVVTSSSSSGGSNDDIDEPSSNPTIEHPESDIDEARSARDRALEQYIQDAARREKMSARSSLVMDENTKNSSIAGVSGSDIASENDDRRRSRK